MSRKTRTAAKGKSIVLHGTAGKPKSGPADLLRKFKGHYERAEWVQALPVYREWANKFAGKADPQLENELMFRAASCFFVQGNSSQAKKLLDEAMDRFPDDRKRCLWAMALIHIKKGSLEEALVCYQAAGDGFHELLVRFLLPEQLPAGLSVGDCPVADRQELAMLLTVLLSRQDKADPGCLVDPSFETINDPALKTLGVAVFSILDGSKTNESALSPLLKNPLYASITAYLLLLLAIRNRNYIKVRNLLRKGIAGGLELIDSHLILLLKEQNHQEIAYLIQLLGQLQLEPPALRDIQHAMQFQSVLANIDKERWESAYDDLEKLPLTTPELIHNRALLCQKLERYAEANKLWALLLGREKKPKRNAPAEVRAAYAVILKNIGDNYLKAEKADDAETCFREALDLVPDDAEALEALTVVYDKQDRLAELLHCAGSLLDQHPANEDYFMLVVSTMVRLEKNDEIISLYTDWLQRFPAIRRTYGSLMAMVYINAAFEKRYDEPQEAAELLRLSGKAADESSTGRYLRGFFHDKAQNGAKAEKEYTRAEKLAESHGEQSTLANAFYQDGYMDKAMRMFQKIAGCTCDYAADLLFDKIIPFLAKAQDLDALRNLITGALHAGHHPYDLANMLYTFDQPGLARELSAPLMKQPYDLENHFMHLLILNRLGERDEAIRTVETMIDQAKRKGDETSSAYFKDVLKQLRSRGQSRILLEKP